ncbi:MAG: hypothetical protein U5P10_04420 [Spirochaetia bacterium]|nr:hypothetical protein [Spirochaetia bacterium]
MKKESKQYQIIVYTTPEGDIKVDTILQNEPIYLTQGQIVKLFQTPKGKTLVNVEKDYLETIAALENRPKKRAVKKAVTHEKEE